MSFDLDKWIIETVAERYILPDSMKTTAVEIMAVGFTKGREVAEAEISRKAKADLASVVLGILSNDFDVADLEKYLREFQIQENEPFEIVIEVPEAKEVRE